MVSTSTNIVTSCSRCIPNSLWLEFHGFKASPPVRRRYLSRYVPTSLHVRNWLYKYLKIGVKVGVEECLRWAEEEKLGVLLKEEAIERLMDGGKEERRRRAKKNLIWQRRLWKWGDLLTLTLQS
ncbi:hypothetical protein PTKIN_Ptkin01aG0298100 [Pterospermum kingtungense]